MRRWLARALPLAASLLLVLQPAAAAGYALSGKVVEVVDGDTITVRVGVRVLHHVRLAWIDAPEKKQPYGQRSKQYLTELIYDRNVVLDCAHRERNPLEVCVVSLDGRNINLEQVRAGMAWWYRTEATNQSEELRASYEAAELEARTEHAGLWADAEATAPWEWRRDR